VGFFDRSTTHQTNQQYIDTTEIGISGVEGIGFAGGDVNILDAGAVRAALSGNVDVTTQALTSQEKIAGLSIKAAGQHLDKSLDFANEALTGALLTAGAAGEQAQVTSSRALGVLSDAIDKVANASRTDASQVLNTITKYGAWVAIAAFVAFALPRLR
jgi:hypothetical protein